MNSIMNKKCIVVRDATAADMTSIHKIYTYEVLYGLATFEEIPPGVDEMNSRWASILNQGLPYLVAEIEGHVVGYSYASSYRSRPAYQYTIEDSVYVEQGSLGQGIGKRLLSALIERCDLLLPGQMVAVIGDSENIGSIALHRRFGFQMVGTLEAVGFKLGRWVDTVLMQRAIGAREQDKPGN
jgi:L-amino acid N-acyltransferase YncA